MFKFRNPHPRPDDIPEYDQIVSSGGSTGRESSDGKARAPRSPVLSDSSRISFDPNARTVTSPDESRIVYTYHLDAHSVHIQIKIAVEKVDRHSNQHKFSLSVIAGGVERTFCEPVLMNLFVDAHQLNFSAFIFPPKVSLPANCLYRLRVWLRTGQVDHRLFSEDDLWIARDPDFRTISLASFAQFTSGAPFMLVYQGFVGRAQVAFIVRWRHSGQNVYVISMEYESGGAGRVLFDDCRVKLEPEVDPQTIAFTVYSVPITSTPPNASHRLRLWIRTPAAGALPSPTSSVNSFGTQSFIYQRIWKSDDFKLGGELYFQALGSKVVMGVMDAQGPRFERRSQALPLSPPRSQSHFYVEGGVPGSHFSDDENL
ncbi:hypothetical protein HWV62_42352 [Athelia sp. TMB]|nr:hypothetical protein HWV62_42352 [Athelia sp. TMB]